MPLTLDAYLSEPLQRSLIPALLTMIITLIGRALSPRSRLKWGVSHGFVFGVRQLSSATREGEQDNSPARIINYHTKTVYVQNVGRATAEAIEVHFNFKPEHMQIWPTFNYNNTQNPEGNFAVLVENLGPREYFTLELLSMLQLPDVLRVRSKAGEGRKVGITQAELRSLSFRRIVLVLLWLGVFSIVQNIYIWIYR